MNIKEAMKNSIKTEIECTQDLLDNFQDEYVNVVEALDKCEGKIIFVAVGKSGHIAKKLAATYASLGIPSFFVHATECMHGDLGMIEPKDIVIFVSNSGNTQEVTQVVPFVKQIGAKTIAFTGNEKSSLAMNCDMLIYYRKPVEADANNLAPTSSTTITLVLGDAIACALSKKRDFKKEDFHAFHPGGSLGKHLEI